MTDLELYEEMVRLTRRGEAFVLATVIASSGSSPRKPGAKMLVRSDASFLGSVGGGRVEKRPAPGQLGRRFGNLEIAADEVAEVRNGRDHGAVAPK